MDVATLAAVIGTVFAVAATLIILVSRTLTARVKRDLVALVLIWVGTLLLVLVAIPEAVPLLLGDGTGRVITTDDGAAIAIGSDTSSLWHYYRFAVPAMVLITVGMVLQGLVHLESGLSLPMLTPGEAQAMQDAVDARGAWLVWLVSDADPEHPGQVVARAHTLDPAGGAYLPGALIAGTLAELRALLPAGLTRRDPAQMPAAVIEVWD